METRLKELQARRAKTIQQLKDITKYDRTLELLEKYGEEKPRRKKTLHGEDDEGNAKKVSGHKKGGRHSISGQPARTSLPIPATANIQRPQTAPGTPQNYRDGPIPALPPLPQSPSPSPQQQPTAEFAPNAGELPAYPNRYEYNPGPPTWYDRLLDVMLGEDETASKNRIVLICQKCRLVNGQAPPGTKSLTEVGRWRCMSCGAMNGEVDEGKRIVREVMGPQTDATTTEVDSEGSTDAVKIERDDARRTDDEDGGENQSVISEAPPRRRKLRRGKSQGSN